MSQKNYSEEKGDGMDRKIHMVRGVSLMTNLLLAKMTDFHC